MSDDGCQRTEDRRQRTVGGCLALILFFDRMFAAFESLGLVKFGLAVPKLFSLQDRKIPKIRIPQSKIQNQDGSAGDNQRAR